MKKDTKFTPENANQLNLSLQRMTKISQLFSREFPGNMFSRDTNFAAYDLLNVAENARKYTSVFQENLTKKYRDCLCEIFETSQIHLSTKNQNSILKSIVTEHDLVVMDEYADIGSDLQRFFKEKGIPGKSIPHNNAEILEEIIIENKSRYRRIWFLTNSIYPLLGSIMPHKKLTELLSTYHQLFLFVKDCYGLGWCGTKGSGVIYREFPLKDKIIISAQLYKSFNASAEITITPPKFQKLSPGEILNRPMQLAIIKASSVYLSEHCQNLQTQLLNKTEYFIRCLKKKNVPFLGGGMMPYFFIPSKNPELGRKLSFSLFNEGFYVPFHLSPEMYPCQCGISVNISLRHSMFNLKALAEAISFEISSNL